MMILTMLLTLMLPPLGLQYLPHIQDLAEPHLTADVSSRTSSETASQLHVSLSNLVY